QSNQSNYARGSGQSGNAGYGRGGYNNTGYNNTRNTGYSNNNYVQQGYGNQQRGQSNFPQRGQQTNRPSNMGNRQPQYQQGPQTGYGVRTLQINSDGWNEGCENGENFDNPEREFRENGEWSQCMPNCNEEENFYSSEYNNEQCNFPQGQNVQQLSGNLPVQNQHEGNVQIFSQTTSRDNLEGDGSVKEMMCKMLNLMGESQQKMEHNVRETDRKLVELDNKIEKQGFRISYEAGNVPNKQSTNLQTKSGMMHTVHSTSVGMHGASCECSECRQSAQQLHQQNQNFLFDASNNNTPNSGAVQQPNLSEKQTRRDFCEAGESTNRPMKGGDVHSFVQDPREQKS
ncbi:MAG: hypothetical protein GY821_14770, partial [Gammaproteobacteria bacterium]|nr:hypothetical protein [Gammaproteobacteria bacterium]